MQPGIDYDIEKLSSHHQPNRFSLGPDEGLRPLKSFIQRHAYDYQAANIAVTYVAVLPTEQGQRRKIIGYVTLTCSEVELKGQYHLDDCKHANRYVSMPALKVARLACHIDYARQGIGRVLMDFAVAVAADRIADTVGCRFMVTDSKAQSIQFYERMGLTLLDTPDNKTRKEPLMFLDLAKVTSENLPDD